MFNPDIYPYISDSMPLTRSTITHGCGMHTSSFLFFFRLSSAYVSGKKRRDMLYFQSLSLSFWCLSRCDRFRAIVHLFFSHSIWYFVHLMCIVSLCAVSVCMHFVFNQSTSVTSTQQAPGVPAATNWWCLKSGYQLKQGNDFLNFVDFFFVCVRSLLLR